MGEGDRTTRTSVSSSTCALATAPDLPRCPGDPTSTSPASRSTSPQPRRLAELELVARDLSRVQPLLEQVLGRGSRPARRRAGRPLAAGPDAATSCTRRPGPAWPTTPWPAGRCRRRHQPVRPGRPHRCSPRLVRDVRDPGVHAACSRTATAHGWLAPPHTPDDHHRPFRRRHPGGLLDRPHEAAERERGLVGDLRPAGRRDRRARPALRRGPRAGRRWSASAPPSCAPWHSTPWPSAAPTPSTTSCGWSSRPRARSSAATRASASRLPHGWADAVTYVSLSERVRAVARLRPGARGPRGPRVRDAGEQAAAADAAAPARTTRTGGAWGRPRPPAAARLPRGAADRPRRTQPRAGPARRTRSTAPTSAPRTRPSWSSSRQLTSSAIERLEAFAGERAARQEAETAAQVRARWPTPPTASPPAWTPTRSPRRSSRRWCRGSPTSPSSTCSTRRAASAGATTRHVDEDLEQDLVAMSEELPPYAGRRLRGRRGPAHRHAAAAPRASPTRSLDDPPDRRRTSCERVRRLVQGGGIVVPLNASRAHRRRRQHRPGRRPTASASCSGPATSPRAPRWRWTTPSVRLRALHWPCSCSAACCPPARPPRR